MGCVIGPRMGLKAVSFWNPLSYCWLPVRSRTLRPQRYSEAAVVISFSHSCYHIFLLKKKAISMEFNGMTSSPSASKHTGLSATSHTQFKSFKALKPALNQSGCVWRLLFTPSFFCMTFYSRIIFLHKGMTKLCTSVLEDSIDPRKLYKGSHSSANWRKECPLFDPWIYPLSRIYN